jgi:tetratricopeptide (TPR) repeat protein
VASGLLQVVVVEAARPKKLYLPPGVWRRWLFEKSSEGERRAVHRILALFWRSAIEADRLNELGLPLSDGLQACLAHAQQAADCDLWQWAALWSFQCRERQGRWNLAAKQLDGILGCNLAALVRRAGRCGMRKLPHGDPGCDRPASVWHNLGAIQLREGNLDAAIGSVRTALALEKQDDSFGEAATRHLLASIFIRQRKYREAVRELNKSRKLKEGAGDRPGWAACLAQLACIDYLRGKYPEARSKFSQAFDQFQLLGDRLGEAVMLHNLSLIDRIQDNPGEAQRNLEKALGIAGTNEDLQLFEEILAYSSMLDLGEVISGPTREREAPLEECLHAADVAQVEYAVVPTDKKYADWRYFSHVVNVMKPEEG